MFFDASPHWIQKELLEKMIKNGSTNSLKIPENLGFPYFIVCGIINNFT